MSVGVVSGAAAHAVKSTWSIVMLAVAAFVIVTTEYVIVGLLPALARDMGGTISVAGQLVTLFAFTVMLFGPVGLLGNWLGGRYVDRSPLGSTVVCVAVLGLGMMVSVPAAQSWFWLVPALAVWGIAYTALFPICQVRVMKAATHAQALAGTLNVSAANAGTGLGAMLGGAVIPVWGIASIVYVATAIAVLACVLAIAMMRRAGG